MNDAPALKNADVGVAMNSGSDAARDAAHAVLLTDDFSAMVHAVRLWLLQSPVPTAKILRESLLIPNCVQAQVREGRLLFANLRKICAYLITGGEPGVPCVGAGCFYFSAHALQAAGANSSPSSRTSFSASRLLSRHSL